MIARRVEGGIVFHPLSAKVEFESSDPVLAAAVARVLDQFDPVTPSTLSKMLEDAGLRPGQRAYWVMPPRLLTVLMREWVSPLAVASGSDYRPDGEPLLLGLPISPDDSTDALTLVVPR